MVVEIWLVGFSFVRIQFSTAFSEQNKKNVN